MLNDENLLQLKAVEQINLNFVDNDKNFSQKTKQNEKKKEQY